MKELVYTIIFALIVSLFMMVRESLLGERSKKKEVPADKQKILTGVKAVGYLVISLIFSAYISTMANGNGIGFTLGMWCVHQLVILTLAAAATGVRCLIRTENVRQFAELSLWVACLLVYGFSIMIYEGMQM